MRLKEAILSWAPLRRQLFKSVISTKEGEVEVKDLSSIDNIRNLKIEDKLFYSANFNNSSFYSCVFKRVKFDYSTLINTSFYSCSFEDCSFENCSLKYTRLEGCYIHNCCFSNSRISFCIFRESSSIENTWKKAEIVDPLVRECYGFTFEGGKAFEREIDNFYTIEVNNDTTYIFVLKDGSWLTPYGSEVSKENIIKRIEAKL